MKNLLTPRRLGAVAGVAFVVLFIVGTAIHGSAPNPTATAAKVTSFYTSHHSKVLIGIIIETLSLVCLLAWAAALAGELRAAGRHAAAGALVSSITGGVAVAVSSFAVEVALDQAAVRSSDPGFMHGGFLIASYLGVIPYLFIVLAAAAAAYGGTGAFQSWFVWFSVAVGVLELLGGIAVKASGFFSPHGGAGALAILALFVWALAESWILWRSPGSQVTAPMSA